jgi:hypothetical protein
MCKSEFGARVQKPHGAAASALEIGNTSPDAEKSGVSQDITPIEDSEKGIEAINHGISGNESIQIDVVAEAKLVRKLDKNLIPLLFVMCKCSPLTSRHI